MQPGKPWYRSSTLWIFVSLALGVMMGGYLPRDQHPGANALFGFMAQAFVALIKGLVVPLLFSTVVVGIARTGDAKAAGRMGAKALLYFEIVTTLALFLGLAIANLLKPGAGMVLDTGAHAGTPQAHLQTVWEILLHIFPANPIKSAMEGDLLPVVVFAALFGVALIRAGEKGAPVLAFFDGCAQTMFKYTDLVMKLTPLGVLGSMAFNMSNMAAGQAANGIRGWAAVGHLMKQYALLAGSLYLALALLFLLVFVPVMWICRVKVMDFIRAVKIPALTAFSTASSEAALPQLLEETVRFGVPERVAGFVIPTGYSFNLDGSTLYLVLASLAIAQAAHIQMSFWQQAAMVFTFMLASKGVAGVPRGTLVVILATCGSFGLPAEAGFYTLLAVDVVMDMGRTMINVIGNGLASVVIAKWEGVFGTEPRELPGNVDGEGA